MLVRKNWFLCFCYIFANSLWYAIGFVLKQIQIGTCGFSNGEDGGRLFYRYVTFGAIAVAVISSTFSLSFKPHRSLFWNRSVAEPGIGWNKRGNSSLPDLQGHFSKSSNKVLLRVRMPLKVIFRLPSSFLWSVYVSTKTIFSKRSSGTQIVEQLSMSFPHPTPGFMRHFQPYLLHLEDVLWLHHCCHY